MNVECYLHTTSRTAVAIGLIHVDSTCDTIIVYDYIRAYCHYSQTRVQDDLQLLQQTVTSSNYM